MQWAAGIRLALLLEAALNSLSQWTTAVAASITSSSSSSSSSQQQQQLLAHACTSVTGFLAALQQRTIASLAEFYFSNGVFDSVVMRSDWTAHSAS